ncbi:hypothetical protein [Mesorhizobium sp. B2-7-1]|uniref:hypothetical protein n=1 Tax=Mesorhizobium sp. B2-7-1 TaxID=2589909 RepID=UPI00112B7FC0|nr:hypothetical protein [Mesorhizobium sp. B2-7-1]TPJ46842.1 hypothetical protein FJ471_31405 [Mesorhizobium sp. B2-7-1]
MKLIQNIKQAIAGARSNADALQSDADALEASYRACLAELGKLQHAKEALLIDLSKVQRSQKPGENRDTYAQRMWALGQSERMVKDLDRQIADGQARLAEIEAERGRVRKERKEAASTAALAEGSKDGAEALAALADAKEVLDGLETKKQAAARHSDELASERATISLLAHTGDEGARKRLDALHTEISVQTSEAASIEAAIAEARQNVQKAEAAVARQDAAFKAAEVSRVSGLILAESVAFDTAATAMVEALRRRENLVGQLAKLGLDSGPRNHLRAPMTINRALARHGLGQFADFDRGGNVSHTRTLAEHDSHIIGGSPTPRAA